VGIDITPIQPVLIPAKAGGRATAVFKVTNTKELFGKKAALREKGLYLAKQLSEVERADNDTLNADEAFKQALATEKAKGEAARIAWQSGTVKLGTGSELRVWLVVGRRVINVPKGAGIR
jgi:hypothetical protein